MFVSRKLQAWGSGKGITILIDGSYSLKSAINLTRRRRRAKRWRAELASYCALTKNHSTV